MIAGYPIASAPIASIHPGTVWDFSTIINSYTNSSLYGRLVTKAVKSSVVSSAFLSTERLIARGLSSFNATSTNNNLCRIITCPSIFLFSDSQLLTSVKTILVGNSLIKSNSCSNLFARLLTTGEISAKSNFQTGFYSRLMANCSSLLSSSFLNDYNIRGIYTTISRNNSWSTADLFCRNILGIQNTSYTKSEFNALTSIINIALISSQIQVNSLFGSSAFKTVNGSLTSNSNSYLNNNISGIFCGRINTIDFSNFTSTGRLISRIQNNNRANSSLSSSANRTISIISDFISKLEFNGLSNVIYNGNLNVQNYSLLNFRTRLITDINLINKIYNDLLFSGTVLIGPKMRLLQDSVIANLLTNNIIINAIQNKLTLFSDVLTMDSVLSSRITNNLILEDIVGS